MIQVRELVYQPPVMLGHRPERSTAFMRRGDEEVEGLLELGRELRRRGGQLEGRAGELGGCDTHEGAVGFAGELCCSLCPRSRLRGARMETRCGRRLGRTRSRCPLLVCPALRGGHELGRQRAARQQRPRRTLARQRGKHSPSG